MQKGETNRPGWSLWEYCIQGAGSRREAWVCGGDKGWRRWMWGQRSLMMVVGNKEWHSVCWWVLFVCNFLIEAFSKCTMDIYKVWTQSTSLNYYYEETQNVFNKKKCICLESIILLTRLTHAWIEISLV